MIAPFLIALLIYFSPLDLFPFIAKKMNPFLAGCAATWLHGDISKKFKKGLIAEDIVKGIPGSLNRLK